MKKINKMTGKMKDVCEWEVDLWDSVGSLVKVKVGL